MLSTIYTMHDRMLMLLVSISERLGEVKAAHLHRPTHALQKAYRVSVIHATLALEGNPLKKGTIAELLDGKHHQPNDPASLEVLNTQRLQELLPELDPFVAQDFRRGHGELMRGLAMDAGTYRTSPMEVLYGDHLAAHHADAENVPSQMEELLHYTENEDAPLLITSCVLHYGIASLRPFSAGNGRMARLWQKRVLMRRWPVFGFLPVEAFILRTQPAYYAAMEYADRQGDCGGFITYLMERIDEALDELLRNQRPVRTGKERIAMFLQEKGRGRFSRKDYLATFPELSTATASRDLADAVATSGLEKDGNGRTTWYRGR